jgi:hypothetical protein
MIHFACPHCRAGLKADNERIGRIAPCPNCRERVEVPRSVGELVPAGSQSCLELVEWWEQEPARRLEVSPRTEDASRDSVAAYDEWLPTMPKESKAGMLVVSLGIVGMLATIAIVLIAIAAAKQNKVADQPPKPGPGVQPEPVPGPGVQPEPVPNAIAPQPQDGPLALARLNDAMPEPKPLDPQLEKEQEKDLLEQIKGELKVIAQLDKNQTRLRLTVETLAGERKPTVKRSTMVYRISPENLKKFDKSRLSEILKDSQDYRASLADLEDARGNAVLDLLKLQNTVTNKRNGESEIVRQGSLGPAGVSRTTSKDQSVSVTGNAVGQASEQVRRFLRQEEERQDRYGDPVTLTSGQQVMIFASRTADDTLLVLVLPEPTKPKEKVERNREQEARNYLENQKELIKAGLLEKKADLLEKARFNLENFPKSHPNSSKAALDEAKKMLESLK